MVSEQSCSQKKTGMLRSSLDAHNFGPIDMNVQQGSMILSDDAPEWRTQKAGGWSEFAAKRSTLAPRQKHQSFLSSQMPDGRSSVAYGLTSPALENVHVIDLDLHNIPPGADERILKKLTGARHIVKTELGHNSLSGALTGEGRLSIRLHDGQDYRDVKKKLQKAGVSASLYKPDPARNSNFTQNAYEQKEQKKWTAQARQQAFPINKKTNTKARKVAEMYGQMTRLGTANGKQQWK